MRRFIVTTAAAALLATALAPTALAGQTVYNSSGSWTEADAWFDDGSYVVAYTLQDGGAAVDFGRWSWEEVICGTEGRGKNAVPVYGWIETGRFGYGPADFVFDGKLAGAHVAATIETWGYTYESCTDTFTDLGPATAVIDLDFTATGPLVKESGTYKFHIPSEYNAHSRFSVAYRDQAVSGTIDGAAVTGGGVLGKIKYADHANG